MRMTVWRAVGICAAVVMMVGGNATPAAEIIHAPSKDEQEIRALLDRMVVAVNAKDADSVMKTYVSGDELFVFDMGLPRHRLGSQACKQDWQDFFDVASRLTEAVEDVGITVVGKVAYSHSIMHTSWTKKDGSPRELMASVTDVYRKIDGKWLIVQEHWSVPVNAATGQAEYMLKP